MICLLGDVAFESKGINLSNIKRESTFDFTSNKLLGYFDNWQSTGKYTQTVVLLGKLIQQNNDALHALHSMAENKQPVTLAFDDGRAFSVLIKKVTTDQSHFLQEGTFLKQDFEISLVVVHGSV